MGIKYIFAYLMIGEEKMEVSPECSMFDEHKPRGTYHL